MQLVCSDGRRLPVLVNSVLRHDAEGSAQVVRTAIFDATERRSYEEELLAARRRAEESEAKATALARTLQATFLRRRSSALRGSTSAAPTAPRVTAARSAGTSTTCSRRAGAPGLSCSATSAARASAAVVTALARYSVRSEALRTPYPSAVLAGLHETLVRHHPEQFCTAVFVALDRTPEGVRLTVASGGHHLPLRRRAGGPVDTIGETGTILGMLDTPRLADTTTILHPGDVVVLYTDGVTDARRGSEFFDEQGVRRCRRRRRRRCPAARRRHRRRGAGVPAGRRPGRHRRRGHQGPLNPDCAHLPSDGMGHCLSRQSE